MKIRQLVEKSDKIS